VTFLIDTHCWLWWIANPERLSVRAFEIIESGENTILFSAASSWEIAVKYAIGKIDLPEPPDKFIPKRLVRDGITSLPIEHSHALHTATLPRYHNDPFDRMLIAQALLEKVPIMTADPQIERYDVEIIRAD
jgi:PIN domain nuclease of toxin-antitoxin system